MTAFAAGRGIKKSFLAYLAVMGLGIIAAAAGNDAGGITTYSICGAHFGTSLLWMMIPITILLAMVQEMCARMGAVTQKGLGELIREEFGVKWVVFALGVMLVANTATTMSNFSGVAASLEMFGLSRYLTVPVAAILVWIIVVQGNFRTVERVFLGASLVFLTYIVAGFLSHPDWGDVAKSLIIPDFQPSHDYIVTVIATIGTTIAPWMQFFLQSTVVDKGIKVRQYRYQKADVFLGALISDIVAFFIIVACGATLYKNGIRIETAADAARALAPVVGHHGEKAKILFGVGLLNASLLASAVLPLTTAYTCCEAFGWEMGISRKRKEAPIFYGVFTFTLVAGSAMMLLPGLNLIRVMLLAQTLNGILLPVVLVFMLKLINNPDIMGENKNSHTYNVLCWGMVITIIMLTVLLLGITFKEGF